MSFSQMFDILGGEVPLALGMMMYLFYAIAIAFATGKSYQEVYDNFGVFSAKKSTSYIPGASGLGGLIISNPMIDLTTNNCP